MAAIVQSLTITRASLSLGDLVITNDVPTSSTDYNLPEGGLAFPDFDMRVSYAPDADDVPGSQLVAYALGLGSLPLTIDTHGTSLADLQVNRRGLEAAFAQSGETVTLSIGGETETYPCIPTWPKWGAINSGALQVRIVSASLTVPVNPMEA